MNNLVMSLLTFATLTCGAIVVEANTGGDTESKNPKLEILEPTPKSNLKVDKLGKGKFLKVAGKIKIQPEGWTPALVIVKVCKDKKALNVISSHSDKPRAELDGSVTFTCDLNHPMKNGTYYVIAVGIAEKTGSNATNAIKKTPEVLKSEPAIIEFTVTDK